jgi:hypothetical protein
MEDAEEFDYEPECVDEVNDLNDTLNDDADADNCAKLLPPVQINELAAQCYLKETNLPIDR